jgi:hypothetical protein
MDPGEQTTGTRDEHYNLVSVLYHALHGAENCDIYALDAEAAGRIELSDFFREAQAIQRQLADEAKDLLGIADAIPGAGDVSAGGIAGGAAAGGATLEGDVPPGAMPEDVPPTAGVPSGMAPPPPDTHDIPPDIPGGVPPGTEDVPPPDVPRTEGVAPGAEGVQPGAAPLERDIPPETEPIDVPPTTDVQREAQVRGDEIGVPDEEIPPTIDVPRTPPDAGAPDTAIPPEEDVVVEPTDRPVEEVPPRGTDIGTEAPPPGSPRTEFEPRTREVPPSPGEPPLPSEEPPEAERSTRGREYFGEIIRDTGRRSRGEI